MVAMLSLPVSLVPLPVSLVPLLLVALNED